MRMISAILAMVAMLGSTGSLALKSPQLEGLDKVKKMRDANEYMADRHAYYDRVDLSFSMLPINSELPDIKDQLTDISCEQYDGCEAKDKEGNGLYFWGAEYEKDGQQKTDHILTIKTVVAAEFQGRSIGALGIGTARTKAAVLRNIEKFLPGLAIDCDRRASGNVGPVECLGTVDPGWFQIGFDEQGNLLRVRFDAYHFT